MNPAYNSGSTWLALNLHLLVSVIRRPALKPVELLGRDLEQASMIQVRNSLILNNGSSAQYEMYMARVEPVSTRVSD